jgi:hypothetical protein
MQISYNSASIARSCWMKYKWKYMDGLEPITKSTQLTLGTVMHEAFDLFYKGESSEGITSHIVRSFDNEIAKQEAADIEDLTVAKYTAIGMWAFYPHKNLKEFQEIYSEEETRIPIGSYEMVIKVDGRVKKDNVWWVRELKTTSLSSTQFQARTATSAQATGYVYGLRKKGYDIKGIMFDYIKKPILRKNKNEDMYAFGNRIMRDYKDRPSFYFNRYFTYRTEQDLKLYEKDMLAVATEIERRRATGEFYRNQDSCWNFNAECPYRKICFQEQPDTLTVELYFTRREVSDGRSGNHP